jgi:hypothetical protein
VFYEEKSNSSSADRGFSHILWNRQYHYRTQKNKPPVPNLSQINPVQTPPHFLTTNFNIFLPSNSRLSMRSLSFTFPHQYPLYNSPLTDTCYMASLFYFSKYYHLNNIIWTVQTVKLNIMNTYRCSFLSVRYTKLYARTRSTATRRTYSLCYTQHAVTIYSHTICW